MDPNDIEFPLSGKPNKGPSNHVYARLWKQKPSGPSFRHGCTPIRGHLNSDVPAFNPCCPRTLAVLHRCSAFDIFISFAFNPVAIEPLVKTLEKLSLSICGSFYHTIVFNPPSATTAGLSLQAGKRQYCENERSRKALSHLSYWR